MSHGSPIAPAVAAVDVAFAQFVPPPTKEPGSPQVMRKETKPRKTTEEKKERRSFGQLIQRGRVWYIRLRRRGRVIYRAVGPSKAMAAAKLAQMQTALMKRERLGIVDTRKISLESFWPTPGPILQARLAPKAYSSDEDRYEVLKQYFGDKPICHITSTDIEDFRTWMTRTRVHKGKTARPSTVNRYLAVLSNLFKEAMERGYAHENPVRQVKRAKEEQKEMPFYSAADIDRIVARAVPLLKPVIVVAADTGLRRGELLALEWRDVQFGRGALVVRKSKSKRPREVPLTSRAKETLKALHSSRIKPEENKPDYVFAHIASLKPSWAATFVASRFRKAAIAAGFPNITFHGLRHAFCSRLAQSGVPLPTVKALAGHGSLALTSRYASHIPENAEITAVRALESADDAARQAAEDAAKAPEEG